MVHIRPKGPVPVLALEWQISNEVPNNLTALKKAAELVTPEYMEVGSGRCMLCIVYTGDGPPVFFFFCSLLVVVVVGVVVVVSLETYTTWLYRWREVESYEHGLRKVEAARGVYFWSGWL